MPITGKNLYVGNLAAGTTADELRQLLAEYGVVNSAEVVSDERGRSRGFGVVEMSDGGDAAIASLNGTEFNGQIISVNEAQQYDDERKWDSFDEVMDRYEYERPQDVIPDLQRLAESGHVEAAFELASILYRPGPYHDPQLAYKWFYISLSQQGYSVAFSDENHSPPHYCGPVGDFRNECMVSDPVAELGFDTVRSLDVEAARWLVDSGYNVE